MKSFEEHLRGAKAHNREDKIWLVTCFSGKMAKLCAKYGFLDDEDTRRISLRGRVITEERNPSTMRLEFSLSREFVGEYSS